MQTRHEARQTLARVVKEAHIGPYVGALGKSGHVYVVSPSRRAVVSERKVVVYSPNGGEAKTYRLPRK